MAEMSTTNRDGISFNYDYPLRINDMVLILSFLPNVSEEEIDEVILLTSKCMTMNDAIEKINRVAETRWSDHTEYKKVEIERVKLV